MDATRNLGIRWTVGDVSRRGFEALRLSVWGARKLFGPAATYAICVNTLSVEAARSRVGPLPDDIRWHAVSHEDIPAFLRCRLGNGMAEGAAWKFAPLRLFPDRYELALDNDCILWGMPDAIRSWLADETASCVLAEDVEQRPGAFSALCGDEPRNAGIRGVPPGFNLEQAIRHVLIEQTVEMTSELDEQGLQTAALTYAAPLRVVDVGEVTICSPFPPHLPELGGCGAHFVGLNAHELGWSLRGRAAVDHLAEHWRHHRPAVYERVGIHEAVPREDAASAKPSDELAVRL